jgi:hypothetical protein
VSENLRVEIYWGLYLRSMGAKQGVSGYEAKASVAALLLLFPAPVTLTV